MDITLWRPGEFKKRENSTKQPTSGTGTRYTGIARNADPFSLLSPSIVFDFSEVPNIGTAAAPPYTYAYVADFSRYYFIDDWTHDRGRWIAHLRADVLASFKAQIADEDLYVLRASAASNGNIVDTKYPITAESTYTEIVLANMISMDNGYTLSTKDYSNIWGCDYDDGYFCVGVTSSSASEGGCVWYCMDYTGFRAFCASMYNLSVTDMGSIPEGIAQALADPIQWVSKVIWTPFPVPQKEPGGTSAATIYLGKYPVSVPRAKYFRPMEAMSHFAYNLRNVPSHPQLSTRGRYTAATPYSKYVLHFYPFGDLEIDGSTLAGRTLLIDGIYDFSTGLARIDLYSVSSDGNTVYDHLGTASGTMGVQVPMTQALVDYVGAAKGLATVIGGVAEGVTGLATGGAMGGVGAAAGSAVGGFFSTAAAAFPSPKTTGGGGDYVVWSGYTNNRPRLSCRFNLQADEYNEEIGRPLCKVRKPKNIPGYIMANNAKIEITGLKSEEEQIEGYLNGGFFYE